MGNPGFQVNKQIPPSKSLFYWIGFGLACVVIFLIFVAILVARSPNLLDPFTKYPNSLEISQSLSHGSDSLIDLSCSGLAFIGEKYNIYASKDSPNSIMAFYNGQARSLAQYPGSTSSVLNNQGMANCFFGKADNHKVPINAIVLLDSNKPGEAKIISHKFPTAPSNMTIIIALQGLASQE